MRCRRDHERFLLEVPLEATVHILSDIVRCPEGTGDAVQVIANVPALADDVLTLDVIGAEADATHVVRVVESRPVIVNGEIRHEIQLQSAPAAPRPELAEKVDG